MESGLEFVGRSEEFQYSEDAALAEHLENRREDSLEYRTHQKMKMNH